MVCRQCSGRVWAVERMQPSFLEFLGTVSGTRCVGHVQDAAGSYPDFHIFLVCGHGVQAMSGTHLGLGWDVARFLGISWQFLGLSVQAMFRTPHGHGRDASWPRQGCILIFRHLQVFCGHDVQAISETCPSRDRDAA
ncbi:Hypothetical predicted protein [Olea europaea subsp. europaea]|uniref:Uncharacterized protein n=1 Tax=Olea europaea subsp. europaea TaxID=158383 RepID=A0A8S0PM24_OLEEU|nr:Hypothetical predicted protein [Olea europaea subsp. europaea]